MRPKKDKMLYENLKKKKNDGAKNVKEVLLNNKSNHIEHLFFK